MNEKILLEVTDLCKNYPEFSLSHINFSLRAGSITGFIGKNGAGKSTTMKSIMQLVSFDRGSIRYLGKDLRLKERVNISFIGENTMFYNDVKLKDITFFVSKVFKENWNNSKYLSLMNDVFCINDNKRMKELSTGMRMKYMIALELSKEASVLLLDEPTSGLDPVIRDELLDILYDLAKNENKAILISSHITEDIEMIADNVIYIDNGKIVLNEKKDKIKNRFFKILEKDIELMNSEDKNLLKSSGIKKNGYYIVDLSKFDNCNISNKLPVTLSEVLLLLEKVG